MRTRKFGAREVSVLALGSTNFGGACPEERAVDFLDAYAQIGGNFVDTAHVYGDFATPQNGESERVIGRWMEARHNRKSIFLSTKGGHPDLNARSVSRLSRAEIRQDMQESLEALRTDHVDVYWLHRDDPSRAAGDIMESLHSLVEDGSTHLIGVSNWPPARIREANAYAQAHGITMLSANQPQFSLAEQAIRPDPTMIGMDSEAYRMHLETGMIVCAYSSQAKGFFTKYDALGEENLPDRLKQLFLSPFNRAIYGRLCEVRERTGLTVQALALAYMTCQPFPVFPLVGASRIEHVEALKEAGDAVISDEDREFLRSYL